MTKMKKLTSVLLAVVMAMGLAVPAFAEKCPENQFTVYSPVFPNAYILVEQTKMVQKTSMLFKLQMQRLLLLLLFLWKKSGTLLMGNGSLLIVSYYLKRKFVRSALKILKIYILLVHQQQQILTSQ